MDNVAQYQFDILEVGKLLIVKQGIKEGLWTVGVQFGVVPINAGPDKSNILPSMLTSVKSFVLTRATESSPQSLTIDAASCW